MRLRNMMFISLFVAIVAVLGLFPPIPIPFLPIPITLQTFGVILAGAVLGARHGGIAMFIFIALIAAGAPLLSGGRGGLGVLFGPSGGYILGFPVVAFFIGYATEKMTQSLKVWKLILINFLFGVVLMNVLGVTYLSVTAETPWLATAISSLAFFPGDSIKAVVAAFVTVKLYQVYPINEQLPKKVAS